MTCELALVHNNLNSSSTSSPPAVYSFGGLPEELFLQILQRVCEPKDFANFNFVSKTIYLLNQSAAVAGSRVEILYARLHVDQITALMFTYLDIPFNFDVTKVYSNQDYITAHLDSQRITQKFYDSLPEDLQSDLRRTIWAANGCRDNEHDVNFAEYMIANEPNSGCVRHAIELFIDTLTL